MEASDHNVCWVSPYMAESLGVTLASPGGEFRVASGEPGEQFITDQVVVWVEENPGDPNDPSGHFKPYEGEAKDYAPTVDPEGNPFGSGAPAEDVKAEPESFQVGTSLGDQG